ncbi:host attachment family protein [Parasphingopyxis marina]|uniref:Host attachment protein n=1 Tax=Parasphingopyxis marina TaxID=2761622 RepID=A0A842HVT0_9SPHN|nr:host attachment family protein [Parasphingopyxis marina]MBC2778158.1 host attachment protein [Parasphingopyxis marina]
MRIPNDTCILVADGRKMLFFRNEGDADYLQLELETKRTQDNPPNREHKTDSAGRNFSSAGPRRSKMQETDFHQLEEDRFAAETADLLYKRAHAGEIEKLLIVAPPRTLGELRRHYHREVEERLVGEIDKDLTGHSVADIEKAILNAG